MRAHLRGRLVEAASSPEVDDVAVLRDRPRHASSLAWEAMAQGSESIRDAAVSSHQVGIGTGCDDPLVKLAIELVAKHEIAIVEGNRCSSHQQADTGHRIGRSGLGGEADCPGFENR